MGTKKRVNKYPRAFKLMAMERMKKCENVSELRAETLDARTDIFSFGLVLYEMATGQRALSGETAAVVQSAILNDPPLTPRELNSTLPPKFVTIIDKALEKDREQRYQSAAEMRVALQQLNAKRSPSVPTHWKCVRGGRRPADRSRSSRLALLACAKDGQADPKGHHRPR